MFYLLGAKSRVQFELHRPTNNLGNCHHSNVRFFGVYRLFERSPCDHTVHSRFSLFLGHISFSFKGHDHIITFVLLPPLLLLPRISSEKGSGAGLPYSQHARSTRYRLASATCNLFFHRWKNAKTPAPQILSTASATKRPVRLVRRRFLSRVYLGKRSTAVGERIEAVICSIKKKTETTCLQQ